MPGSRHLDLTLGVGVPIGLATFTGAWDPVPEQIHINCISADITTVVISRGLITRQEVCYLTHMQQDFE